MYQSSYFVSKSTGTFSDTLMAFGLAYLLRNVLQENDVRDQTVRIVDQGSYFAICLNHAIQPGYENIAWFELIPFLETSKNRPPEGWIGVTFDFDAKREEKAKYFEALRQMPVEVRANRSHPAWKVLPNQRNFDLDYFEMIYQMSSLSAYNKAWSAWRSIEPCFPQILKLILELFASPVNNMKAARKSWKGLKAQHRLPCGNYITPVQCINPAMGMGYNREKMDGAIFLNNPDSFWLLELLKFFGGLKASIPRSVRAVQVNGPRDRKTYVVHPKNLTLATHDVIFETFNKSFWSAPAIQLDIVASLKFTSAFLQQWIDGQTYDPDMGQQPGDYVSYLEVACYKAMGRAVVLINLSEIALPVWMGQLRTREDAQKYKEMLEEHRWIIWRLNEKITNEFDLLKLYRDFLSGHELNAFLQFLVGYSHLLMTKLGKNEPISQFSAPNLEVLIMAHDSSFLQIVQNDGFRKIAKAICHSTVVAQRRKAARDSGYPYKPRYGLAADLARHAAYPDKFIAALCEFVVDYNQEILRVNERFNGNIPPSYRRPSINQEDLQQVIAFIDERRSSELIARLLVAFGYAGSGRKSDVPTEFAAEAQAEYELDIEDDEEQE